MLFLLLIMLHNILLELIYNSIEYRVIVTKLNITSLIFNYNNYYRSELEYNNYFYNEICIFTHKSYMSTYILNFLKKDEENLRKLFNNLTKFNYLYHDNQPEFISKLVKSKLCIKNSNEIPNNLDLIHDIIIISKKPLKSIIIINDNTTICEFKNFMISKYTNKTKNGFKIYLKDLFPSFFPFMRGLCYFSNFYLNLKFHKSDKSVGKKIIFVYSNKDNQLDYNLDNYYDELNSYRNMKLLILNYNKKYYLNNDSNLQEIVFYLSYYCLGLLITIDNCNNFDLIDRIELQLAYAKLVYKASYILIKPGVYFISFGDYKLSDILTNNLSVVKNGINFNKLNKIRLKIFINKNLTNPKSVLLTAFYLNVGVIVNQMFGLEILV